MAISLLSRSARPGQDLSVFIKPEHILPIPNHAVRGIRRDIGQKGGWRAHSEQKSSLSRPRICEDCVGAQLVTVYDGDAVCTANTRGNIGLVIKMRKIMPVSAFDELGGVACQRRIRMSHHLSKEQLFGGN